MSDEKCGNCRYFRPPPENAVPSEDRGICAIAPVQVLVTLVSEGTVNAVGGWPPTLPAAWCGKWEAEPRRMN